jgi:Tol biopolymer transport system component
MGRARRAIERPASAPLVKTPLATGIIVGLFANGPTPLTAISADGRYAVFTSAATNLVAHDTNGVDDVFIHDRQTDTTRRVSLRNHGGQANGQSLWNAVSARGRYVAFVSSSPNLVAGDSTDFNAFVRDRVAGTTEMAVPFETVQVALSPDARYVLLGDVLWDRRTQTSENVAVSSTGQAANRSVLTGSVSAGGRYVEFSSSATNLVPRDTNRRTDVFVRDRGM